MPEKLPQDLESCHEVIRELRGQVQELRSRLDYLARRLFGRSSERFDSPDQLQLFADEPHEAADQDRDKDDEDQQPPAPPAPRKGHGRKGLPKELPRKRIEHDVSQEDKTCSQCGRPRPRIGEDVSEQLEYRPASLFVIEHVRPKYGSCPCGCCAPQGEVVQAPAPDKPIDKGLAGPGLVSHVITSKYADHLPLYRLERILARQGVEIRRSTLWQWVVQGAQLLHPVVEAMKARLLESHVIHSDDSPLEVLVRGAPKGTHRAYLWVYVGDRGHPYTLYDFSWTRDGKWPKLFLADFEGRYLQADCYAGYNDLYVSKGIAHVACWAHVRRKFFEAKSTMPVLATQALVCIRKLYDVEQRAKELDDVQRQKMRQSYSVELLEKFFTWLKTMPGSLLPKSPLGKAVGYALSNRQALTRYTCDGRLDIDNNEAERAIRPLAIGRKNWLFTGSECGGKTIATLLSLIESAKRHQKNPFAYIEDLLRRISTHPQRQIDLLLPDKWSPAPLNG